MCYRKEMNKLDYTPVKTAFISMRIAVPLLIILALFAAIIGLAAWLDTRILVALVLPVSLAGLIIIDSTAAFKKQLYSLQEKAIFFTTGNLLSDHETELKYNSITHVRLIKPFIEYKLFGTGKILIEAAGSSETEVIMQSVANPERVYKQIQRTMAGKGFRLQYGTLLSKEQPARVAVLLEVFGSITAGLFVLTWLAPSLFGVVPAILGILPVAQATLIGLSVGGIALAMVSLFFFALYQDLRRRTYYIYDDVICYTRGFLTKQEAFIPIENLADSRLTQGFLDKLLGLYDVIVSCQGSGNEIPFRNLRAGKKVERVIDKLINETEPATDDKTTIKQTTSAPAATEKVKPTRTVSSAQASYKMNFRRTLIAYAPLLPIAILLPPILIAFLIYVYVVTARTEYKLTAHGVASYFTFLSTRNIEYTSDKITGVIVQRTIIDRWLKTCTVVFWSIGSTSAVKFRHIDFNEDLEARMKDKAGISEDEKLDTLQPQFNLATLTKAHLYVHALLTIALLAGIIAALWSMWFVLISAVLAIGYVTMAFFLHQRYRRARLRYGEESVSYQYGWLKQLRYHVSYDNIKDATITAYPASQKGTVQFNVAGEQATQTRNSGVQYTPNSFRVRYLQDPNQQTHIHNHILDRILIHRPDKTQYQQLKADQSTKPQVKLSSNPSLKNPLTIAIAGHGILLPTIVLLPVTVLLIRLWVRRVSYNIEESRTLKRSGILYRKQTSIVFPKLDYIKQSQGLLNKVCGNGNLSLYTTGSRQAELIFSNLPEYRAFHRTLKKHYEQY